MTIANPLGRVRPQATEHAIQPLLVLTGALAAVLTVTALSHDAIAADALLPAVSLLFFVLSAAVALVAWRYPISPRQFSYWDAAGVLTAIGIGIAAAVEPEQMVRLVAGTETRP